MAQNNDGPVDHEVPVLKVSDKAGRLRAVLFGYACHNTTLSINEFCGDYAGFAQRTIEAAHPGATALFMIGAGGDQNPYPRRELEHAERHGLELGDAVNRAMDRPMTPIAVGLRTARDNALLDFAPLPPQSELDAWTTSKNVRERLKGRYLLERLDKGPPLEMSYALPIQVAQFGGQLLMIAIGGEVVVDYSRRLKTQLAGKRQVWVAGYSNDIFGYLPSRRVLLEGGYEGGGAMLYQPLPGPFTDTVEDRVLSTVHRLVGRVSVAQ